MKNETHLTLVFDVTDMDLQEIADLTHRRDVCYMAWGHVPYERDRLKKQIEQVQLNLGSVTVIGRDM
jgi:hypothetical protein